MSGTILRLTQEGSIVEGFDLDLGGGRGELKVLISGDTAIGRNDLPAL